MMGTWSEPARDALELIDYRGNSSVLVISDSAEGLERGERAVALAGCRVSGTAALAEAAALLDSRIAVDAVALLLERGSPAILDPLLERLEAAARDGRYGSVVAAPAELTDAVAARISHRDIHHLCEPSDADWVMAVELAAARGPLWLNDISKDRAAPRLQQLSEEVGRIANILASLSEEDRAIAPTEADLDKPEPGRRIDAGQIRAIIRARRMRDHFFRSELFADPAWDMLLDLMAARLEKQKVAVSSLCIAAAVPPTTALRWIKTLSEQGLFVRVADAEDGRRVFIELSDRAAADFEAYLKSAQRVSSLIV
jgi:winged helix DNA-binding protein